MAKLSLLTKLIRSRRSTRRFKDTPVARKLLEQCAEAARLAPSACNSQPWRFVVVDQPELKAELARRAFSGIYSPMKHLGQAPVLVALLAKLDVKANRLGAQVQGTNYYLVDLGIAGEHFVLRAHELGLGSCWIGWFSERGARKALKVARGYKVSLLIAVGYPAKRKRNVRARRSLKEVLFFNGIKR